MHYSCRLTKNSLPQYAVIQVPVIDFSFRPNAFWETLNNTESSIIKYYYPSNRDNNSNISTKNSETCENEKGETRYFHFQVFIKSKLSINFFDI